MQSAAIGVNRLRSWPKPIACLTTRVAWRTWTPSPLLRRSPSGGPARLVRRDGATDRL